jgi:fumarate reductase subunit C
VGINSTLNKENLYKMPETLEEEDSSIHTYVFIDENPVVVLENMKTLENHLNRILAQQWWQKYIAAAFWSNMSTPVNLTIMLLTTLTTGQATTSNLLSSQSFVSVSIASLILSVINTFFRPHAQMNDNLEIMRK